ncbi:MAG: purine-nucleoside phosphorylase [Candidatus Promineifilaceae bacterium]
MTPYFTRVQMEGAAAIIRNRTRYEPTVGLVLGSGLNDLADAVTYPDIIPSDQIPHWPQSTVSGHHGRLVIGQLEGKTVLVLQGRVHFYEGYSPNQITLPVRVMQILGIKTLILTNAAGGINETFTPGDLMLLKDHLNIPGMAGHNPLRGPNDDSFGPRFPDMVTPYDPELRQMAHDIAAENDFSLQEGVYAYVAGPNYETPAELRFLRLMGADAVGMSTVPSVLVARHAGMRVLGISTVTNLALPDPPPGTVLSHEEVLEMGKVAVPRLTTLLHGIIRRL